VAYVSAMSILMSLSPITRSAQRSSTGSLRQAVPYWVRRERDGGFGVVADDEADEADGSIRLIAMRSIYFGRGGARCGSFVSWR
jgi:hypothetical protein